MRFAKNIERLILKLRIKTEPETKERILGDALETLEKLKQVDTTKARPNIWRTIMKDRRIELVGAAAIVIAALAAMRYFSDSIDGSSFAWARVAEEVEQMDTFTYRKRTTTDGLQEGETVLHFSPQYGVRLGRYSGGKVSVREFVLPAEKVVITIIPQQKKYVRMPLTADELRQMRQASDPRRLIRQFMSGRYTDLDRDNINGVEVYGMEVKNPPLSDEMLENAVGRLWVSVETDLPVRMELEGVAADGSRIKMVIDTFRWDAELTESDFGPTIPPDYTVETPESK